MKKKILITLLAIFSMVMSLQAQYHVNYISSDGETITLRSVGYAKNAKLATSAAETSAVKALMFYGIPNTQQSRPMVEESMEQALKDHKKFLTPFFDKDGYRNVITRSVTVRKFGKDENKQKSITLDVTINVRALRTELERNGVIRKFGL